eukprot:scaffold15978_cov103-Isochrysis_galbana.AAC.5
MPDRRRAPPGDRNSLGQHRQAGRERFCAFWQAWHLRQPLDVDTRPHALGGRLANGQPRRLGAGRLQQVAHDLLVNLEVRARHHKLATWQAESSRRRDQHTAAHSAVAAHSAGSASAQTERSGRRTGAGRARALEEAETAPLETVATLPEGVLHGPRQKPRIRRRTHDAVRLTGARLAVSKNCPVVALQHGVHNGRDVPIGVGLCGRRLQDAVKRKAVTAAVFRADGDAPAVIAEAHHLGRLRGCLASARRPEPRHDSDVLRRRHHGIQTPVRPEIANRAPVECKIVKLFIFDG